MENNNTTSYNSKNQVFLPMSTESFAIDKRNWSRIKDTVENCVFHTNWWEIASSVFGGGTVSAFITWLSLPRISENKITRIILLCASFTCLIIAILCFLGSLGLKGKNRTTIESVKKEIKFIEDSFQM